MSEPNPSQAEGSENRRGTALAALLQADQCCRWERGERILVETYLEKHADLLADRTGAVDLVYGEFILRQELGETPQPEEYIQRFPQFAEELSRQFEVYRAFAGSSACSSGSTPTTEAHATFEAPVRIARFEIKETLGSGSFGCVYRAYDPQLGRDVALKVLHRHLTSEEYRERFLREGRAAAQLQHPNLVAVYENGLDTEGCYISAQLVRGLTLAQLLKEKTFSPMQAAELIRKLAQAVHHAHGKGVIHRDLKTTNVLVDAEGEPYVSDFGLVRLEGEATLTADAAILGTPAYMAPEQAAGTSHAADARSDVYSLGVILYELLTGRLPFTGSAHSVIRQVIENEPPRLRSLNHRLSRDLETICLKAMSKQPADRYPSAQHLADDLGRWLAGESVLARRASAPERFWRLCRRNPATSSLVAAVVLALAVGAIVSTFLWIDSEAKRQLARRRLYIAEMRQAQQEWQKPEIARMIELLGEQGPTNGDEDFRDFEWHYLWRLCHGETQVFHVGVPMGGVAFNPDGRLLAVGDNDGTVRVWDRASGREIHRLRTGRGNRCVAFSQDGQSLAATSGVWGKLDLIEEGDVKIWDVATGKLNHALKRPLAVYHSVAFSPDGRHLLSGGMRRSEKESKEWAGDVTLWDLASEKIIYAFPAAQGGVCNSVAFSRDGQQIAWGGGTWDPASEDFTQPALSMCRLSNRGGGTGITPVAPMALKGHSATISEICFSPDGRFLASAGARDRTIRLWDSATGNTTRILENDSGDVGCIAFSPDGRHIAAGIGDRTLRMWDISSGQLLLTWKGHRNGIGDLTFSPDGRHLASSAYHSVRIWDAGAEQECLTLRGFEKGVWSAAFSPDGRLLAVGAGSGSVQLRDMTIGQNVLTIRGHDKSVNGLAFAPDGRFLATASSDRTVKIWNVREVTGELTSPLRTLPDHSKAVSDVRVSPDGRLLASSCRDGMIRIWDAGSGALLRSIAGDLSSERHPPQENVVQSVAFSPGGKYLASAGDDFKARIWDIATGRELAALPGHGHNLHHVVWKPDGKQLASTSADATVKLWDTSRWRQALTLKGHTNYIWRAAFSPNGNRLATAGGERDEAVRVWDTQTGQEIIALKGHTDRVNCVVFSPDGYLLVSGSSDGTVRIWNGTPADR